MNAIMRRIKVDKIDGRAPYRFPLSSRQYEVLSHYPTNKTRLEIEDPPFKGERDAASMSI